MDNEKEYIDKDEAKRILIALPADLDAETVQRCIEAIDHVPAAEVEPKRYPGFWIEGYSRQKCSMCAYRGYRSFKFCPNCGNPKIPMPPKVEENVE